MSASFVMASLREGGLVSTPAYSFVYGVVSYSSSFEHLDEIQNLLMKKFIFKKERLQRGLRASRHDLDLVQNTVDLKRPQH